MFSVIRNSSLLVLCAVLCSCVSSEQIIQKDSATIDLKALEKFGKRVEKYDFAPHRGVFDISGGFIDNEPNVMQSMYESCKRVGGEYRSASPSGMFPGVGTSFSTMFLLKLGQNSNEKPSKGLHCRLSGKKTFEITTIVDYNKQSKKQRYFAVVQEADDIKTTESLIAKMQEEKEKTHQSTLQSAIDDWHRVSEMLRNDVKPGDTFYFISEAPLMMWVVKKGLVVEVKQPLALVQFQNDNSQWVKIEEIIAKEVPDILFCRSTIGHEDKYKGRCFKK
jgi:hypothetical protein